MLLYFVWAFLEGLTLDPLALAHSKHSFSFPIWSRKYCSFCVNSGASNSNQSVILKPMATRILPQTTILSCRGRPRCKGTEKAPKSVPGGSRRSHVFIQVVFCSLGPGFDDPPRNFFGTFLVPSSMLDHFKKIYAFFVTYFLQFCPASLHC